MISKKVLFIFGTRPEAIKMAPLIILFKEKPDKFNVKICITAQHREMLDDVLSFFQIEPDFDLNIMKHGQSLFQTTAKGIAGLDGVISNVEPDLIFVQGDTTTAFVGALAGYYKKIDVAHLEAGLRSGNIYSPYPEEVNRKMISQICKYHFTPTDKATENLRNEGFTENIFQVGNSVIDALFLGLSRINTDRNNIQNSFEFIDFNKKVVLITSHRRESFGKPMENIFSAVNQLSGLHEDVEFVYPVHPNPQVKRMAERELVDNPSVHLIEPLSYPELIWLLSKSYFVMTDSGGIQEEAPSLGKPVVVLREVTERMEGVEAGSAVLVGSDKTKIIDIVSRLLTDYNFYQGMTRAINPYGDGKTAERICNIIS